MNKIRTLIIITLTFCVVTMCGKYVGDCKDGNYFLLIKEKETISLNTYENNKIKEHKLFAVPEKSIFTTDQKRRVAILDIDKKIVILYDIQTTKDINLSIPFDITPKTILIHNDNLFIGGGMGKEILVQYCIQSGRWFQLEIPEEVSLWGKAIDDLVVNDRYLIAIDNVVFPKYILFYHLNSKNKLALSHFKQLNPNGAYETIRQGRITPKYLGLLSSTTSGYSGSSEHITIYNNLNLTSSFTISLRRQFSTISDFLLIGDNLFIAHRVNGLGTFEIKNSYFKVGQHEWIDADEINYKQFENEQIIRLTLIPNDTKIILTIENSSGKIRHEIIEA